MLQFFAIAIVIACIGVYYSTDQRKQDIDYWLDKQSAAVKNYNWFLGIILFSLVVHLILVAMPWVLSNIHSGLHSIGVNLGFMLIFLAGTIHLLALGIWVFIARRWVKAGRKIKRIPFALMGYFTLLFGVIAGIIKLGIIIYALVSFRY